MEKNKQQAKQEQVDTTYIRSSPFDSADQKEVAAEDKICKQVIKVLRYIPEIHKNPEFAYYKAPFSLDSSILTALHYIKENLDSSLSYRYSCQMAICGSCSAMVNGQPKLLCQTFLKDYAPQAVITIEPLAHFLIIRDLIVEISDFIDKLVSVKPYIISQEAEKFQKNKGENMLQEFVQTQAQLQVFKRYSMCINCLLCYAACPQYGRNKDFVGPAALALATRYNLDSRDNGKKQRSQSYTEAHDGLWECTFAGFCSQVCPKMVNPATAIQSMKLDTVLSSFEKILRIKKVK